jgi:predicted ArsR family transcriptional regulator
MPTAEDHSLTRALADDRRARLVDELRSEADGLDVQELARRLGLHANTVRWHLGVLRDAGAVSSTAAPVNGRGRPRILYRLERPARDGSRDEYRLLATILSGTLAEQADGDEHAARAGRAWGRYLVERPLPLARVNDAEATEQVVRLLDDQGFAAEAENGEIRMRRCPFHDLAEAQPDIVCAVHRGLISGALEELGSELEVEGLDVFVEPDLCIAHLARRR